ncbi:MAG: hypothetical protein ACE5KV_04135 [Thermoplasmata archaeon]
MFRRILVLADNYHLTDFLLRYIPNVFPSSEYHVLSIIDYGYDILSVTDYIEDTLEESAIRAMLHCASVLEERGVVSQKTILKGNFQAVVEKYTRENEIDLIATETYIDEDKKKSHITWHLEGLFKSVEKPILIMDRAVELKKPDSVSILYTGARHSKEALVLGLELAKWLEASCLVLHVGERAGNLMRLQLDRITPRIGTQTPVETRECASAQEIVDILANYDLFVMSRGGRSLADRVKMFVRRLPLSKVEIDVLMYAPIPTILVGGKTEGEHG